MRTASSHPNPTRGTAYCRRGGEGCHGTLSRELGYSNRLQNNKAGNHAKMQGWEARKNRKGTSLIKITEARFREQLEQKVPVKT